MTLYLAASEGTTHIKLSITFGKDAAAILCNSYGEATTQEGLQKAVAAAIYEEGYQRCPDGDDANITFGDKAKPHQDSSKIKLEAIFSRAVLASIEPVGSNPYEKVLHTLISHVEFGQDPKAVGKDYNISIHEL